VKWRLDPALAVRLGGPPLSLLARTWQIETEGAEHWAGLVADRRPFIFMLWHEVLFPLLWHHRHQGVAIVVSEAKDGRYLAAYAETLGYRIILGSTSRGGVRALLGAVRRLENGIPVAFTPDGPRGPRHAIKPGMLLAAQRVGGMLLPIHAEADRSWRLNSWDQFLVPKPFARVRIRYGEPFSVDRGPAGIQCGQDRAFHAMAAFLKEKVKWPAVAAMPIG
jgi:lysophospholipid acyltransferase (LPLAT)-like uncharacterized protein